jgi:type II secretory pathway pseudopilin PulG
MTRSLPNPRHAGRAPRVPFAVLVTALIVGGMALLLLLNTASAANEVSRHSIAAQDASVAANLQELQQEVAASAAPANLAAAAAALGMVPAANPAFLVLESNDRVRVMGSPAAISLAPVAPPSTQHTSHSAKATATATKTKTAGHTGTANGQPASKRTTSSAPKSSPKPTPTPTPTPTLTLPGGNR